ncbi:MAG: glycosyl hydrolase family 18 protein [Tissierellia bacterium]|nr:glycosyl hydrolase family 18 protein [Tissierellia bacterium]
MKKILAVLLAILLLIGGGVLFYLKKSSRVISTKYDGFHFISEDKDIDESDFDRIDGQFYLSFDYIKENIDETIFYDENEKTVVFTNNEGTKEFIVEESRGFVNGKEIELRDPVRIVKNKVLVPIEVFIYDYPVDLRFVKDNNVLLLDRTDVNYAKGHPKGDGIKLREDATTSSPIIRSLKQDQELFVYGESGKWYKVRQIDGFAGYILKDELQVDLPENPFVQPKESKKTEAPLKEPLNLTWDYTYGNETQERINKIKPIPGVNKVCPTWFSISNGNGDLIDRGNIEYVNRYRSFGIDVWGYLDNSFDPDITHEALQSTATRRKIINGLIELLKKYDMKGINIDFEHTKIDDRDLITQFVRELTSRVHLMDVLVSVDVTPQISNNVLEEPYHRMDLAKVADFIMLMAYDQHWGSSPKAGSVAEYWWVEGNLNNLFRQIPMEKLVLGIPLYTRIWTEENGKVSSTTATMAEAKKFVNNHQLSPEWLEDGKQYYVEAGSKKIWLEELESISWKTSLVNKYHLAGVASWRKGFETDDIWLEIDRQLQKTDK